MHHLYPSGKGDALCPLGFHPQVRWPTRCKRCFRDYKEHGGRKTGKEDITASSPSLSSWNSQPQIAQLGDALSTDKGARRSWASSSNLYKEDQDSIASKPEALVKKISTVNSIPESQNYFLKRPASWTSTPDLNTNEDTHIAVPTVSIILPRKRPTSTTTPASIDTGQKKDATPTETSSKSTKTDLPSQTRIRTRKPKETTTTDSVEKPDKKIQVKEVKNDVDESTNHDVQFLIQVKAKTFNQGERTRENGRQAPRHASSQDDDVYSIAGTETTDTTLVDKNELQDNELQEQIESLKQELEMVKTRCEKAEREKSDMLLRRLATYETTSSKTTASEVLKLQQKCNELQTQLEDMRDDKKSLNLKVKELEAELDNRPNYTEVQKTIDELKSKLNAAETLCEELMDENEDMKKEMRELEEEMEEMQDNFREDQADEYTSLKKELEQTTKNCRILSFKLRKTERKVEQLETEKQEAEKKLKEVSDSQTSLDNIEKIKRLEQDLNVANEVAIRLQKELDDANTKLSKASEEANVNSKPKIGLGKESLLKKKTPSLGMIGKIPSGERVSRESLTRGGSQDDPVQLLRDLQDSLEREADLREQLKFAEEEAQGLRKKASRVEDDNESLVMQLKKMATKTRGRKLSPSATSRLIPDTSIEKDEGISEDDDPSELKLLLELSEQEAAVLRRKVEDMEAESETLNRKLKDAQTKLNAKVTTTKKLPSSIFNSSSDSASNLRDQKLKVLEDETCDLRKKLIEKERDCERLYAELSLTQKRSKSMVKSKSLDGDQQTLDLRRQLQVVEQEAVVLQSKLQTLETDNEKLASENRRLLLVTNRSVKKSTTDLTENGDKTQLEASLTSANEKITELSNNETKFNEEIKALKKELKQAQTEKEKLNETITRIQSPVATLQKRVPKVVTEVTPKSQLKKMVAELEKEIGDILINLKNSEEAKTKLEDEIKQSKTQTKDKEENEKLSKEVTDMKKQIKTFEKKIIDHNLTLAKEKGKSDDLNTKIKDLKDQIKKLDDEKSDSQKQLKKAENEHSKLVDEQKKDHKSVAEKEKKIEQLQKEIETLKKAEKEKSKISDQLSEKNKLIQESEKRYAELEDNLKKVEKQFNNSKESISKLEKELEAEKQKLQQKESEWTAEKKTMNAELMERKKLERMKANYEKQQKNQQQELLSLKMKIQSLESGTTGSDATKLANKELTNELSKTKQLYDDLTSKYEILEEEFVDMKAQLVLEKETVLSQLKNTEVELNQLKNERDSLSKKHTELQDQNRDYRSSIQNNDLERTRMKAVETRLEEKCQELEQFKRETEVLEDQFKNLRKENEDLKQKLDDFHKVSKVQRNINADNTALDKELAQLKTKLTQSERSHRADVTECKMRYESQIHAINDELQNLQNQVMKFKRERDMFKHMFEGTQKALSELKNTSTKPGPNVSTPISNADEVEETKMKTATLEQQVSCLEDELSEARLESTKLKTELVSERSSWEVKLSEMRSRVNELEEDRLLSSGRTKIMGIRTKMELAWQKEREEQQRLLQETSTLARDLRQTLFEVERERDKERLEARRKQDQLKKAAEEEQEENRKKLNELQCDLLELRDAHAKLRTTNEKLRREKERNEREKDELKANLNTKKKGEQDDEKRVNVLLDQVERLLKTLPESQQSSRATTPTPPRRTRSSKSRESSPSLSTQPGTPTPGSSRRSIEREIQNNLQKIKDAMQDARQDKTRIKVRRATSSDQDRVQGLIPGLNRRSLSLEPGNRGLSTLADETGNIWSRGPDSDSLTSLQSLDNPIMSSSDADRYYSMDSRLSGGSTQSEVLSTEKKKKKGIIGTLKKLTKSRSIDDQGSSYYKHSGGSDSSIGTDDLGSKTDLKGRITGIFKRSGSSSRSNSVERKQDTSSLQRPVKFSTPTRPSPSPSESSISIRNSDLKLASQSRPSPSPSETSITLRNSGIKLSTQVRPSPTPSETSITLRKTPNVRYK